MVFDHMVSYSEVFKQDEFETVNRFHVKKVVFRDGVPNFIREEDGREIRALI